MRTTPTAAAMFRDDLVHALAQPVAQFRIAVSEMRDSVFERSFKNVVEFCPIDLVIAVLVLPSDHIVRNRPLSKPPASGPRVVHNGITHQITELFT
jgi:hypothetical protein